MTGRGFLGGSLLLATLLLGACVSPGLEHASPVDEAAAPIGDLQAQPFRSLPAEEVVAIRRAKGDAVARCMASRGFVQFLEYEIPDEAVTAVDDIGIGTYSFGPVTESEAQRQGYSPLMGLPPMFPQIVAQDAAFEQALKECNRQAWDSLDPEAEASVRSLERLSESLHNAFVDSLRASDQFRELHQARVSCLAEAGFPVSDASRVWLRPGPEDFGVPFGEVVEVPREDNPSPGPGRVVILYPPELQYVPTAAEVEIALADVACRGRLGFVDQVTAIAAGIQRELLGEVEANVTELRIVLERIVAGLGSS